ncbi:hypothetical protein [Flexithrix dorotheae]|uniref:hypothetical protein n=1 Tax=Flexithrix dorotheae TaxID=70993 RepID=UPI000370CDA8|nr:hypothetical protein [Flexithrix dorotheae]
MKIISTILFLLIGLSTFAQKVISSKKISKFSTYVKGKNFEGVIFSKEYQMPFSQNPPSEYRFTPTINDIELVERLLNNHLKEVNKGINQGKNIGPTIHKKLKKYQRQYIGFISEKGERYIYLSCNWDRYNLIDKIRGISKPDKNWMTEYLVVFDGGSYHWNIQINLDKKELINLRVNGVS